MQLGDVKERCHLSQRGLGAPTEIELGAFSFKR